MPDDATHHAPAAVLRRVRASRSVLSIAELRRAFIRSLPFAGAVATLTASAWYFTAGSIQAAPAWLAPGLVAAAFVVLAAAFVVRRSRQLPTMLAAAVELDQSSKTHSSLASSLELSRSPSGPFEQWALANAVIQAERGDLTMPSPAPADRAMLRLSTGGGLLAAAILFVTFIPPKSWSPQASALAASEIDPARLTEVQQTIESARVEVAEAAEDLGIDADDQFFDSLEAELEDGLRDPDEAIARAAEQLDKLAEQAETEADRAERARDDAAERLAELAPEDFTAARNLAESLAAGDFNQAAQEAEALQSQLDDGSTRDDLRRLADQLEQAADRNEPLQPPEGGPDDATMSEQDSFEQDLRDLADDLRDRADDAQSNASPPPPSQTNTPEPERSQPPPDADSPAESDASEPEQSPGEQQETPDQTDQGQPQQEDTSSAGQDQSSPDDQAQTPDQSGEQQSDNLQREQSEQPDSQQQPQPDQQQQRQPGEEPGDQQQQDSRSGDQTPEQPTPDEQTQEPATRERPSEDQPTPDRPGSPTPDQPTETRQDPQPDANAPERQAQPQPDQSPSGPGSPDSATPGQPTSGNPESPSADGSETQTPGDQAPEQTGPGNQPANRPGGPSQDPNAEPSTLERLAQEQRRADELRRFADDLRDRADQMLDDDPNGETTSSIPEAGEVNDDETLPPNADPWSAPTELIDARDREAASDARERVISEWFKDPEGRPLDAAAPAEVRDAIRRAARDAERAVEQQTVPRRYEDLVRRVFERYARRAEDSADATDASDAE